MSKGRLEAFSDGVFAIIITILVLELHAPEAGTLAALRPLLPVFLGYVLSFIYVGIYWNNHHHLFQVVQKVNGPTLWANLHLLFWLSLFPFITGWAGEHHTEPGPVAVYGVVLLMAALAYFLLTQVLTRSQSENAALAAALGKDVKGKLSLGIYLAAIPLAFVRPWLALALYAVVAALWFIPDTRIEKSHTAEDTDAG